MLNSKKPKIIVVLGPTSSGKSDLAVNLAKKFNGEIISADSRQVYKEMDIGSGKITKKEMRSIPHHLLDVASPKKQFCVSRFQKIGQKAISRILKKNKLPIICGGTGFYIDALIYDLKFPKVKPDFKLRKELEKLPIEELYKRLKKLNPKRANNIDEKNPRRLIRAIEIALNISASSPNLHPIETEPPGLRLAGTGPLSRKNEATEITPPQTLKYNVLKIGIKKNSDELKKRIEKRLLKRLKQKMIAEVKKLRKLKISWKRLESFGLEYKYIAQFLQNKIGKDELIEKIKSDSYKYAKRQMTWWKRDKDIFWVEGKKEAGRLIGEFLN